MLDFGQLDLKKLCYLSKKKDEIPRQKKNLASIRCTSDADLNYQIAGLSKVPGTVEKFMNKNCHEEEVC